MINKNEKETEFIFQFLGKKLKFDDIIILFILYILYIGNLQNSSLFYILILLFFT